MFFIGTSILRFSSMFPNILPIILWHPGHETRPTMLCTLLWLSLLHPLGSQSIIMWYLFEKWCSSQLTKILQSGSSSAEILTKNPEENKQHILQKRDTQLIPMVNPIVFWLQKNCVQKKIESSILYFVQWTFSGNWPESIEAEILMHIILQSRVWSTPRT